MTVRQVGPITLYDAAPDGCVTVSPSALDTARDCLRKWAIDKLAGAPRRDTPSTILGTKVHKIAERYGHTLNLGLPWPGSIDPLEPLPGEIFESVRPHLAAVGVTVEREFWYGVEGLSAPGVLHGLIDVHAPRPQGVRPLVQDIKSTKDWKWQKTGDMLATDSQGVIYGAFAIADADSDEADLEWLYSITTGRKRETRPTRHRMTRAAAFDGLATLVVPLANTLVQLTVRHRAAPFDVAEVPPTPSACQKYGGCPYYASPLCNLSADESIAGYLNESESQTMSGLDLMSQLNQQLAPTANVIAAPPAAMAPVAPAPAAAMGVPGLGAFPPAPVQPAAVEAPPGPGSMAYETAVAGGALPPGTVAPNGKVLPPTVIASGVMRVDTGFAAVRPLAASDPGKCAAYLNLAADHWEKESAPAAVQVNPPEAAKALTDDEQRAKEHAPAAPAADGAPAKRKAGRPRKVKAEGDAVRAKPAGEDVTLYIGCMPIALGEETCALEDVFADAHAAFHAANPTMLDFAQLGFGEGAGRFRVYCEAAFDAALERGERDFTIADPTGREASIALATLRAKCTRIVQGLR